MLHCLIFILIHQKMLILFVSIMLSIGAAIMGSIYAIFTPFMQQLGNIQNYNIAYYGAIASIERANLVLRWHSGWFEWSWWWIQDGTTNSFWPTSDTVRAGSMWLLEKTNNEMWREISSMVNWDIVPQPWNWDMDPDLSSGSLFNYNKLEIGKSKQIALYKDIDWTDSSKYYVFRKDNNWSIEDITTSDIKISIRVPQNICNKFKSIKKGGEKICTSSDFMDLNNDLDQDWINDDIIVSRSFFWYSWNTNFFVVPTLSIMNENFAWDTNIRESVINNFDQNKNNIIFKSNDRNPIVMRGNVEPDTFNQVPMDLFPSKSWWLGNWFSDIINNSSKIKKLIMKFSTVNMINYSTWLIYPYLEIKIDAWKSIPSNYFTITWHWKVFDYDVKIRYKKNVFNVSESSDFTILF